MVPEFGTAVYRSASTFAVVQRVRTSLPELDKTYTASVKHEKIQTQEGKQTIHIGKGRLCCSSQSPTAATTSAAEHQ